MAISISLDNILKSDKLGVYADKTNKNCTSISLMVEDLYNKYFLDSATKSIGYNTPINLLNTKSCVITVPSTQYNGEGIVFKQSGTGTELASIKVDGSGAINAVLGNITATSLTLTGALGGSKITLTDTNTSSVIPYLTSANMVMSGGINKGYANGSYAASPVQVNSVDSNKVTINGLDKVTASSKIYTITGIASGRALDVFLPNLSQMIGYEYTIMIIPSNATNITSNFNIHPSDEVGTNFKFINNGTNVYNLAAAYNSSAPKTITFQVVANGDIWIKSVV